MRRCLLMAALAGFAGWAVLGCGGQAGGQNAGADVAGDAAVSGDGDAEADGEANGEDGGEGASDAEGAGDGGTEGDSTTEECWLPDPSGTMDCALLCEKSEACGESEENCENDCTTFVAHFTQDAASRIEDCLVTAPCTGMPFAFTVLGCAAQVGEDPAYTPPAGNAEACTALLVRVEECTGAGEDASTIETACDFLGPGLHPDVLARAASCIAEPCAELTACVNATSCLFSNVLGGSVSGACEGQADAEVLAEGLGPVTLQAFECAAGCDDGDGACVLSCVRRDVALTEGCAGCFVELVACGLDACSGVCATSPPAAECGGCLQETCGTDFGSCSGDFGDLLPVATPCALDTDQQAMDAGDVASALVYCAGVCKNDSECGDLCFSFRIDVSDTCSTCSGQFSLCGIPCLGTCQGGPTAECMTCLDGFGCLDDWEMCAEHDLAPPHSGACVLPGDQAGAADGSVLSQATNCSETCDGAQGCVVDCVVQAGSVRLECAACFAAMETCTQDFCGAPCSADATGIDCTLCRQEQGCLGGFVGCAGVTPYELPSLGEGVCAEAVECSIQCRDTGAACVTECVYETAPAQLELAKAAAPCAASCGGEVLCIAATCWAEYAECTGAGGNKNCLDLQFCSDACGEPDCVQECLLEADSLDTLLSYKAVIDCIEDTCGDDSEPPVLDPVCIGKALQPAGACSAEQQACVE